MFHRGFVRIVLYFQRVPEIREVAQNVSCPLPVRAGAVGQASEEYQTGERRIKLAQNQAGQGQSSQKVIANEKRGFKGHDNY